MTYHMVVAANGGLYVLRSDGVTGAISLAALPDVSVLAGVPARFATLNRFTVVVNAVSQPIWIDTDASPHHLGLLPPATPPTIAAGAATGVTGDYSAKVSFLVKDALGNVLAESPLSSASATVTFSNQKVNYSALPLSAQASVNARRVYRTAAGGSVYYHAFDVDDNSTVATITDATADAALSITPAPDATALGTAPSRLYLITEWKGRLWGAASNTPDTLYGTAADSITAWPLSFPVRPIGADSLGISGFLPRRDELGVLKRNLIWKMTGDAEGNFRLVKLVEGVGCVSPDTCKVIRDVGFFLGGPGGAVDGVYVWGPEGVQSITDDDVRPWFTTDTYFNRAKFPDAFAAYDPVKHTYNLYLCAAGGTTVNRWISYDLKEKHWLGPHQTATFVPSSGFVGYDGNGNGQLLVGSVAGHVYKPVPGTYTDGTSDAIDLDLYTKFHAGDPPAPDITHLWLQPTVFTKKDTGGTLTLTPYVGGLDASAGTALSHALTSERERLPRPGVGRLLQFRIRQNTAAQGAEIYGYAVPYIELGRR